MKFEVFSVRDSAANAFGRPFFLPTIGVAIRSFADQVNASDAGDLFSHPEDFELFHCGQFDDSNGLFELFPTPNPVVTAKSVVHVKN